IQTGDFKTAKRLPRISCVYFVLDSDGKALYIGKAVSLRDRWNSHQYRNRALNMRLAWLELPPKDLTIVEALMIQSFSPEWNVAERRKDDDSFLRGDPERFQGIWST